MAKNLEERVKELEKDMAELKRKATAKIKKKFIVGDVFQLMGLEWKILDITEQGYVCLAERLEDTMTFGSGNDWKDSEIREFLNGEFCEKLVAEVGEENVIPFERNLWSLDGQTEYGTCEDKVSLITMDEYRKYRSLIPNADYWWWTITPDSTKCNNDSTFIRVVSASGFVNLNYYYSFDGGVRPFCIFSSAIFESEDN